MEKVKASGKARSIGVSNYFVPDLVATMKTATVTPSINQIEYHPYLQHGGPEGPLLKYMREHNIANAAYGPLTAVTKAKPGPCDEVYASLAKKYYVSEGEIALRWCIDQDVVVSKGRSFSALEQPSQQRWDLNRPPGFLRDEMLTPQISIGHYDKRKGGAIERLPESDDLQDDPEGDPRHCSGGGEEAFQGLLEGEV